MSMNQCDVIRDLMPLYIDEVCSEESRRLVFDHMKTCGECRHVFEIMNRQMEKKAKQPEPDSSQAFRTIHKKWNRKKLCLIINSVFLTMLIVGIGAAVFQNVKVVHDFFDPYTYAVFRDVKEGDWHHVSLNGGDFLEFDSIFYEKEVILDGNSSAPVHLRIWDVTEAIVVDETLEPGRSLNLDILERGTPYVVEIQAEADFLLLRFE